MIHAILAHDSKFGIGRDGTIPWRIPPDLRRFRALTSGHAVVMGRRTWESLPGPLPGRTNVVVSRTPVPGILTVPTLAELVPFFPVLFVIGGARLYAEAFADPEFGTAYVTEIEGDFGCDVRVDLNPLVMHFDPWETHLGITFRFGRGLPRRRFITP